MKQNSESFLRRHSNSIEMQSYEQLYGREPNLMGGEKNDKGQE